MAFLLGVDTGGTYTDAVIIDDASNQIIAKSKSLTTRPDLALGVGRAIDAVLAEANLVGSEIGMVSLSTTLATNALVEGQGGKVALVFIGFEESELARDGLQDALGGDPVLIVAGGHDHAGSENEALDVELLSKQLGSLPEGITGFAVASRFATRNPSHENEARELIRNLNGSPVTCSHELSSALGGPKRALTAVLNARLIGMIDRLIQACENHLIKTGIDARMMVVRGDGALVSAEIAREKPIETILSGPAASIEGARWLTNETDALVSDIGGTTTDICLLTDGRPQIDPDGARVGPYRTMVEAVAMRTTGLGGDSEVHVETGLKAGLRLGPKRLMPISLLAAQHPELVKPVLEAAVTTDMPILDGGQFVVPLWKGSIPSGLDKRENAIAQRLTDGPQRMGHVVTSRIEGPALGRLVSRGLAAVSGVTPSDAAHVLGLSNNWDSEAAEMALELFARQRSGSGDKLASGAKEMAMLIVDQLCNQTVTCILETAFAEDHRDFERQPNELAIHPLTMAGLDQHSGILQMRLSLGVPVIGLGASASSYYPKVGERLHGGMILPEHAEVANAIGAVVGQVTMQAKGTVSASGPGTFVAYLKEGPSKFSTVDEALAVMEDELTGSVVNDATASGVETPQITTSTVRQTANVENTEMFISAEVHVIARGRPRIAKTG